MQGKKLTAGRKKELQRRCKATRVIGEMEDCTSPCIVDDPHHWACVRDIIANKIAPPLFLLRAIQGGNIPADLHPEGQVFSICIPNLETANRRTTVTRKSICHQCKITINRGINIAYNLRVHSVAAKGRRVRRVLCAK